MHDRNSSCAPTSRITNSLGTEFGWCVGSQFFATPDCAPCQSRIYLYACSISTNWTSIYPLDTVSKSILWVLNRIIAANGSTFSSLWGVKSWALEELRLIICCKVAAANAHLGSCQETSRTYINPCFWYQFLISTHNSLSKCERVGTIGKLKPSGMLPFWGNIHDLWIGGLEYGLQLMSALHQTATRWLQPLETAAAWLTLKIW